MLKRKYLVAVVVAGTAVCAGRFTLGARAPDPRGQVPTTIVVKRQDFVRSVRLNGTVEAVEATSIAAPRIAGQNDLAFEEAQARLRQLQETYDLKRKAAAADIKILEIRRDRSRTNIEQAQTNADRMLITSPLPGVAVIRTTWKNSGNMVEFTEGDEIRPGQPVVEVVNPAVMRVRARVNQTDMNDLRVAEPVRIGLDAYPDLSFDGTVAQISPIGTQSQLSPKVRTFIVLVLVKGAHPNLMPDLTASLDVELERTRGVLVVPRDAVIAEGEHAFVMAQRGGRLERQDVTIGA